MIEICNTQFRCTKHIEMQVSTAHYQQFHSKMTKSLGDMIQAFCQ